MKASLETGNCPPLQSLTLKLHHKDFGSYSTQKELTPMGSGCIDYDREKTGPREAHQHERRKEKEVERKEC
ncbi:hypothetical protein EYF80_031269 [Liparis tanakae]|uniref:Uncharacterized protein n=1 Tax=Liparis tanakae TaxID=230148 RepID=A0A4Z2GY64_9TELE|nr:hypothetical protein EYF80_031269 [Liparis tanakae]